MDMNPSDDDVRSDPAQRVMDLLPYGVIATDREGRIIAFNAHEERQALMRREAVIGRNFFWDVAPCTQVKTFYGQFAELMRGDRGDDAARLRFFFALPSRPREVDISFLRFLHLDEPLCVLLVRDTTDEVEARQRVARAKALTELDSSSANIVHSLRNVLANIVLTVEVLAQRTPDEQTRERLLAMRASAFDARDLINRMLAAAKQPAPRQPVDGPALLQSVVEMISAYREHMAAERGITIVLEVSCDRAMPPILGSQGRLREVLINLLRNAIEAMTDSGRIVLTIDRVGERARIIVRDEGSGMSREALEHAFTPLFTTKGDAGAGLGLATCYAIVRELGGDITIASQAGIGTSVIILLPLQLPQ
jgi:photoactive yellow protein